MDMRAFFSLSLFFLPIFSGATHPHPHRHLLPPFSDNLSSRASHAPPPSPTLFFEVTNPINHPKTTPCSHHLLLHDFAYTYARPPVVVSYAPPSHCPAAFSTAVLEWSATCQGRQFDRIFGVCLSGVELLRSCTAEPTRDGIFWNVRKDITRTVPRG